MPRTAPQHEIRVNYWEPNDPPYDRELIRSGGVSGRRARRPDAAQAPRGRARRARRPASVRRGRSIWGTIKLVFLLAIVGIVAGALLLGMRAAAFNGTVSTAGFPSSALLGPLNGSERVNVLMVGYGGGDHDGAYLADSIQVLSIDPSTDTTTSIPIPRDLWIEGVDTFSQNGKVNEVFADGELAGGIDEAGALLARVLTDVTGLRIDHWLSIDFQGFRDMVDAVGGVTVSNPVAFAYTTNEAQHQAGNWTTGSFAEGELHLDGTQALAYTRARYTSVVAESTDFARSVRQARVLGGLRAQVGEGGIGSILPGMRLMDAMEGRVRTDLSAIDLFLLSSHLASDRRIELEEGPVLTATTNTIGQYILVPIGWVGPGDYGRLQAFLADRLAQPIESASSTDAP